MLVLSFFCPSAKQCGGFTRCLTRRFIQPWTTWVSLIYIDYINRYKASPFLQCCLPQLYFILVKSQLEYLCSSSRFPVRLCSDWWSPATPTNAFYISNIWLMLPWWWGGEKLFLQNNTDPLPTVHVAEEGDKQVEHDSGFQFPPPVNILFPILWTSLFRLSDDIIKPDNVILLTFSCCIIARWCASLHKYFGPSEQVDSSGI